MPPTRRLPVLQNASTSDDDRPAWHWSVIGLAFVFSIWVPLAMIASFVADRVVTRTLGDLPADELGLQLAQATTGDRIALWLALTAAPILSYAFSCAASGTLVGRFGGKAGPKEAALAGALAAIAGAGVSLLRETFVASAASLLLLVPIGVGMAWLGGKLGFRLRKAAVMRKPPPPPAV
jgi:tRNA-(ms[2]io[6]A)-hydroxylase